MHDVGGACRVGLMNSAMAIELGDTVKATYHGVDFEGVVVSFDASGYVNIKPTTPFELFGSMRDRVALDVYQRRTMRLVKRGNVKPEDVAEHVAGSLGGAYLRTA